MLVLQTLQWGPRHGYGITQAIRANSGDAPVRGDRLALSGAASDGARRADRRLLEAVREQSARSRVPAHGPGPAPAHIRPFAMGTASGGHRRRAESHQAGQLATPAPEGTHTCDGRSGGGIVISTTSSARTCRWRKPNASIAASRPTTRAGATRLEFGNVCARQASRARGERLERRRSTRRRISVTVSAACGRDQRPPAWRSSCSVSQSASRPRCSRWSMRFFLRPFPYQDGDRIATDLDAKQERRAMGRRAVGVPRMA